MRKYSILLGILALMGCVAGDVRAADYQVVVVQLAKKVDVSIAEGAFVPAVAGMKLSKGDRVHTSFKASCVLGFPDGSMVEVMGMTMLQLDKIDVAGIATRARMLLRTGEVRAQINRSMGARGDFQVQTPTTTASVRGTEINRISYDEGSGTQIRMGGHGLLAVLTPQGHAFLRAHRNSAVRQRGNTPVNPVAWARGEQSVDSLPQGSTESEHADARDVGVPRSGAGSDSGSSLANRVGRQPDAMTVVVVPQPTQPVITQPPLIPTPFPLPPTRGVPTQPPVDGTPRTLIPGR